MVNPHERTDVEESMRTFLGHHGGYQQHFLGIPLWKTQPDMIRYEEVARRSDPDVLIETGSRWGGSAIWFAVTLGVKVFSVDAHPAITPQARKLATEFGVTFFTGDAISDEALAAVRAWIPPEASVMVSLDADHHAPYVTKEILHYREFVTRGCYLVVEDGIADVAPDRPGLAGARNIGAKIPEQGGPLRAIEDTLAHDPQWKRELEIERMSPITHHVAGWWRRV